MGTRMDAKGRRKPAYEKHVRIHQWEMNLPAWQTLSPIARALLIEMRALYNGTENFIFLSQREAARRLNVPTKLRAANAIKELIERGWIRVLTKGGFNRKTRHATEFALENEPLNGTNTAPKAYARWQPPPDAGKASKKTRATIHAPTGNVSCTEPF